MERTSFIQIDLILLSLLATVIDQGGSSDNTSYNYKLLVCNGRGRIAKHHVVQYVLSSWINFCAPLSYLSYKFMAAITQQCLRVTTHQYHIVSGIVTLYCNRS